MIFKWIIGSVKIALGILTLLGSIITISRTFDSIDAAGIIGGSIAILLIVGYGFSAFTNGLAEFKHNTYHKIFLRIETICGFLFSIGFIIGTLLSKQSLTGYLILILVIIIFLTLSIRNIVILKKDKILY